MIMTPSTPLCAEIRAIVSSNSSVVDDSNDSVGFILEGEKDEAEGCNCACHVPWSVIIGGISSSFWGASPLLTEATSRTLHRGCSQRLPHQKKEREERHKNPATQSTSACSTSTKKSTKQSNQQPTLRSVTFIASFHSNHLVTHHDYLHNFS